VIATRRLLVALAVCTAVGPAAAGAQVRRTDPATPPVAPNGYPELRLKRELIVSGMGAGLLVGGFLLPNSTRTVPTEGLDPAEISLGIDRDVVGNTGIDSNTASAWTRDAAMALPFVLAFALAEPGHRWDGFGPRTAVYAETLLFSQGVTLVGKAAWERPRPFAYLPAAERPDDPNYDVTEARTFHSMPSGHSSSAWTGVGIALTEELLSRPDAHWAERFAVGFVGGGLAGATAALRLTAGQHFPTDVIAGSGIGLVTGVTIPLLHRGDRPIPPLKSWLQVLGGTAAGTVVGVIAGL
jgi:membrane-associated phospholipid phosphatase